MKQKIPCIFYLYIHSKIFEKSGGNAIDMKEVKKYLFQWKIPRKLRPLIIREMEMLGLVERKRHILRIERPIFNEDKCNEYYEELGIF